jgi:hypothetical protein
MNTDMNCPKRYRTEFIEPGVVSYEDVGEGKVFVSREALDRFKATFIGKPVVNVVHKDLTFEQAFKLSDKERESMADGIVFDCGWLDNGWCYADMIIWDLETQKNIDEKKFSTSCAYLPTEQGIGGKWHNIDYDTEVLNGDYTHMAIVKKPRYERAKTYELPNEYRNSLSDEMIDILKKENNNMAGEKGKKVLFFFTPKKNEGVEPEKKPDEVKEEKINADESMVDIDGKQIPLSEIIATYQAEQAEIAKKEELAKNALMPEDEVDIGDGKKVLVSELMAAYNRCNAKKNEAKEPEKENAEDEKKEELKKKENSKKDNFNIIKNAVNNASIEHAKVMTAEQRANLGKERYGSKKGDK